VELYELAGIRVDPERFKVGDRAAMLKNCERYVEHRCRDGGPWKSYAELERELAAAKNASTPAEDELEVTLDDEEAAHQETLGMLSQRDAALGKARELISNWRVTANVLSGMADAVHREMYHRCASELEAAIGREG
jgi:hypothetical protein